MGNLVLTLWRPVNRNQYPKRAGQKNPLTLYLPDCVQRPPTRQALGPMERMEKIVYFIWDRQTQKSRHKGERKS